MKNRFIYLLALLVFFSFGQAQNTFRATGGTAFNTITPAERYAGIATYLSDYLYSAEIPTSADNHQSVAAMPDTITVLPIADAFTRGGVYNNVNYGNEDSLCIKTYNTSVEFTRNTYLKFPVNRPDITGAKLRLYGMNRSSSVTVTITVAGVNTDTWTETGITWNNAPATGSSIGTIAVNNVQKYYEIDVTNFVKAQGSSDQLVSFVIRDTANKNLVITFNSKENATNRPELILYVDGTASWQLGGNTQTNATVNFVGTSDNTDLSFRSNNLERFRLLANGNLRIGLGTDNGKKLQVFGSGFFGNAVGIGTDSTNDSNYNLFVSKGVRARKVRVDVDAWPDYVFSDKYRLPTLREVEQFVGQNDHLPGIISAAEAASQGIDLGENQAALLKKIEELTLYIIEQNKTILKIQGQLADQERKIQLLNRQPAKKHSTPK